MRQQRRRRPSVLAGAVRARARTSGAAASNPTLSATLDTSERESIGNVAIEREVLTSLRQQGR